MHYRILIKSYCCNTVTVPVYQNVLGKKQALSVSEN
jgi:hypothetical protein